MKIMKIMCISILLMSNTIRCMEPAIPIICDRVIIMNDTESIISGTYTNEDMCPETDSFFLNASQCQPFKTEKHSMLVIHAGLLRYRLSLIAKRTIPATSKNVRVSDLADMQRECLEEYKYVPLSLTPDSSDDDN